MTTNTELLRHEYWIEYISPLFSSRYGLIYHHMKLESYSRDKQEFVNKHRSMFDLPLGEYLKKALKERRKIISDGNSNVDNPIFLQFLTNFEYWMSKKDVDLKSVLARTESMIRLMIPPTWMELFEIKLKLYKL